MPGNLRLPAACGEECFSDGLVLGAQSLELGLCSAQTRCVHQNQGSEKSVLLLLLVSTSSFTAFIHGNDFDLQECTTRKKTFEYLLLDDLRWILLPTLRAASQPDHLNIKHEQHSFQNRNFKKGKQQTKSSKHANERRNAIAIEWRVAKIYQ